MVYYKLIRDSTITGIGTTDNLRKYQAKHNILLNSDENNAQYFQLENDLFHDRWMQDAIAPEDLFPYEELLIKAVTKEEYESLKAAFDKGEELTEQLETIANGEEIQEEEIIQESEELTADYVREVKIKEMSLACNRAIMEGFEITLSDGGTHHFSLTLQDQANMNSAYISILSGAEEIPYHADGEEMTMFSSDEMSEIIAAANAHKTYHLAYFNSLKKWLNAVRKISTIEAVNYGDSIPKKYQTALLKKYTETSE